MNKSIVRLDAWRLVRLGGRPLTLLGFATGHPRLPGVLRSIRTSLVVSFEPEISRAETLNTNYWLGYPMEKLSRDQSGQLASFELAGLVANRDPATGVWTLMGAGQVIDTPGEIEHVAVVARVLAIQPRLPAPLWLRPQ
jgi:hypothetical protein